MEVRWKMKKDPSRRHVSPVVPLQLRLPPQSTATPFNHHAFNPYPNGPYGVIHPGAGNGLQTPLGIVQNPPGIFRLRILTDLTTKIIICFKLIPSLQADAFL